MEITDDIIDELIDMIDESSEYSKKSNQDLVDEILSYSSNLPDHPAIIEMLNRFHPGWEGKD